jgi:hypothetical protein
MPTSYDGTLLEHLAEHIMYLSTASSFWFSLNSSYDHGCHLSKQMGIVRTEIEEQESRERQTENLKCTCYFKFLEWGK